MLLFLIPLANAATLDVPAAYPTITDALAAAVAGDEIVLAPGVYCEDSRHRRPGDPAWHRKRRSAADRRHLRQRQQCRDGDLGGKWHGPAGPGDRRSRSVPDAVDPVQHRRDGPRRGDPRRQQRRRRGPPRRQQRLVHLHRLPHRVEHQHGAGRRHLCDRRGGAGRQRPVRQHRRRRRWGLPRRRLHLPAHLHCSQHRRAWRRPVGHRARRPPGPQQRAVRERADRRHRLRLRHLRGRLPRPAQHPGGGQHRAPSTPSTTTTR